MPQWLVGLIIVLVLLGGGYGSYKYMERRAEKAEISAALAKGDTVVSEQGRGLARDSNKIYASGVANQRRLEGINAENVTKIQSASGASIVLDDAYVEQLNRGLCKYPETTPGCASN
jgi:hypothetical protein